MGTEPGIAPWIIVFDERDQVLGVTAHGTLNADQLRKLTVEVISAVKVHLVPRVLIDFRDLRPEIGTVDIYKLPELYQEQDLRRSVRAAVVAAPDSGKLADFAFYETVTHNAGYQIHVFTDYAAARQWLLS